MSQTAGFLRLPSDHRLHSSNLQPCGFLTPISPLILYLLAAPGPTRMPVPPQKEPAFLTRRHLQIPWDSGLRLPPSIASQQRRRRERLTPPRWGPAARPSLLQPAKSESPGGGEEAGEALNAPAPPPTPRAVGTAPWRFNARLYLVLHLPGRPLPLSPSPHRRLPGRGPKICPARHGRGGCGRRFCPRLWGVPRTSPATPTPQGSPTCYQVRSQEHLACVADKSFPNDRWTGGGGCPFSSKASFPR